ncbi:MAG: ATP-binding protein [Candidatus Atabeyarchaeum deiterrae]
MSHIGHNSDGDNKKRRENNSDEPDSNIGRVVGASTTEGLLIRLNDNVSPEDLKIGIPIVCEGEKYDFFSIINDIVLSSTDQGLVDRIAGFREAAVNKSGNATVSSFEAFEYPYGSIFFSYISANPVSMVDRTTSEISPPVTVPKHFSEAHLATSTDIGLVYGPIERKVRYPIGTLLGTDSLLPLDIRRFMELSAMVAGVTGYGKTRLAKLLAGCVIESEQGCILAFDMQSEYGRRSRADGSPGLKHFFEDRVVYLTLDPQSSKDYDETFEVPYSSFEPEDLEISFEDLTETMKDSLNMICQRYIKDNWFEALIDYDIDQLLVMTGGQPDEKGRARPGGIPRGTLAAIQRRIRARIERLHFVKKASSIDSVRNILNYLKSSKSVVLDFGRYGMDVGTYVMVSNMITRRLYEQFTSNPDEYQPTKIMVEEGHKFLSPEFSRRSVFGKIAREMRKFKLTLCVVDQRPSAIDDEVISQMPTRFLFHLGEERDIDAALSGTEQPVKWRNVLARIGRQECLGFGYAFPNHTVFKVRNYDESLNEIWSPMRVRKAETGHRDKDGKSSPSSVEESRRRLKDVSERI